jgi:hypothetical protein
MESRLQIVAIAAALGLVVIVLELVRRRRLMERYALLWLLTAFVILGLAIWKDGLNTLASALGIVSGPNALFFTVLGFVLLLLLHFSASMSRLTDQSKVLAQRHAILEERLRELEHGEASSAQTAPPPRLRELEREAGAPNESLPAAEGRPDGVRDPFVRSHAR